MNVMRSFFDSSESKIEITILFISLVFYGLIIQPNIDENSASRLSTIESLVEEKTFAIDGSSIQPEVDKIIKDGRTYSNKPPLLSMVGAVFYFFIKSILGLSLIRNPVQTYVILTFILVSVTSSLLLLVFYKSLRFAGLKSKQKIFLTLVVGFSTPLLSYSTVLNNHTVSAFLLYCGFFYILKNKREGGERNLFYSGLFTGLCFTVDMSTGLSFVAVFYIYLIWTKGFKKSVRYLRGLALPFAVYCVLNVHILGDVMPLLVSHRELHYKTFGVFDTEDATLIGERLLIETRAEYIVNMLVGKRGFFSLTPVLFLAVHSLFYAIKERVEEIFREALAVSFGSIVLIAFYMFETAQYGGPSHFFRYLVPIIPLLMFFTSDLLKGGKSSSRITLLFFTAIFSATLSVLAIPCVWCNPLLDFPSRIILASTIGLAIVGNKTIRELMKKTVEY